jgi:CheY-like chemotaxis protein
MSDTLQALIIDDTEANRSFFERLITQAQYHVESACTGQHALKLMEQMENLTLAIVDMEMPDMSGLELTQRIRKKYPNACIIVATMYDERSLIESAYRRGCDIFLVKPHGFMDLFKKLTSAGTKGMRQEAPLIIDQYGLRPFRSSAVSAS